MVCPFAKAGGGIPPASGAQLSVRSHAMTDPGFMIPLNQNDFDFPYDSGGRDICSAANQQTYTKAPWWTCENIRLTAGGTPTPSAVVGTTYVIQVGIQGLRAQG